ncbi:MULTISPECIES: hydrogenase expression/formation protein HypE [Salinibaculum]|uniref:hydrogenase expression/formation protein HypE n=1 Tax=Salinibaculum TaxID=2732368 RepID=UPI0030D5543D
MSETEDADGTEASGEVVTTAHGSGGGQMRSLIGDLVLSRFEDAGDVGLHDLDDGAVLPVDDDQSLVVTTDSHVVKPPVFPGGDIGRLAVAGTVNDLAVMGATEPLALSCSLVVEEGVEMDFLDTVLASARATCEEAGCSVVTGDTKVMGSGDVDRLVVNTTGVGLVPRGHHVADAGLSPGDAIVVSGTLGDHGIALLSEREGFDFEGDLESDVAPVNDLVAAALDAGEVTAMKDPTRGGFATSINEMVGKADVGAEIDERSVPVADSVAAAGEVLGIEPFDVANEGKVVFGVAPEDAEDVLAALQDQPLGADAAIVGEATADHPGRVVLDTGLGRRYLTEPEGEQLPRIC